MEKSELRPRKLEDIKYELQLLLSADMIIESIELHDNNEKDDKDKFGNIINLLKDSVYLHSRNLLNLLTNQYLTELGTVPSIRSKLYGAVKRSLELYVMHMDQARDQVEISNIINGRHLNTYIHELTNEVVVCWKEWATKSPENTVNLLEILNKAKQDAHNDKVKFEYLLKEYHY